MEPRILICIFVVSVNCLHAQLVWKEKTVELHSCLEETKVHGAFEFENKGKYPIRINDVKTSCGCATASLTGKIFQPGETGRIDVNMDTTSKLGTLEKYVNVNTDDPQARNVQLCFRVVLPELMKVVPTFVYWKAQDRSSKSIEVQATDGLPVKLIKATSSSDSFDVSWKSTTPSGHYEISITPKKPVDDEKAVITLMSDYPRDRPRVFYIYAQIRDDL